MAERSYIPTYTVADYRQWEGDWELWNGVPVAMSPSPSSKHSRLCVKAVVGLELALRKTGCSDCAVFVELDWQVDEYTVVRPDVAIACGGVGEQAMERAPVLAVEVLSPSTRSLDLNERRDLYAREGVRHYFVIDPEQDDIQKWANGNWQSVASVPGVLDLPLADGCTVQWDLQRLFD